MSGIIAAMGSWTLPVLILALLGYGAFKKVKVYESFVDGAKEGFDVALRIIPYLVAILVAVGMLRASGAIDLLTRAIGPALDLVGFPAEALPMALIRPLSGSGAQGVMTEAFRAHGPDSLIGMIVSTMQGSTETTFYVIAVYFGAVRVSRTRHAIPAALLSDLTGIVASVFICRLVFGN